LPFGRETKIPGRINYRFRSLYIKIKRRIALFYIDLFSCDGIWPVAFSR
jgi:hypothetical protein